jgi:uroporphyrinogen decarboxylase
VVRVGVSGYNARVLKPKERIRIALAHEEPDRCPLDLWLTPEVEAALMQEEGVGDPYELRVALGHDCLISNVGLVASFYMSEEPEYVDPWGITFRRVALAAGQGHYTEMVGHPLAGDDAKLASYSAPDPHEPSQYEEASRLIARYGQTHAIVGGILCSGFEGPWYLRGLAQFLTDMMLNKDYAHALSDLVADYYLQAGLKLIETGCDLILAGDDVGTQDRMLISPQLFREFVKPSYGRLFGAYKRANPELRIATHICGYVEPILDDLIETGVDVLNPVQPLAMDPARLKKRYGRRLSFWGAVDDQRVLPLGRPEEVEAEVRLRLKQLAPGGGYILCSSHNVQPGTPLGNIRAFYRAAERYRGYPLKL